jgi:hypothetical protein
MNKCELTNKIIMAVRHGICDNFLMPEKCECEGNTNKDCMNCANDFLKGWEANK